MFHEKCFQLRDIMDVRQVQRRRLVQTTDGMSEQVCIVMQENNSTNYNLTKPRQNK